MRCHSVFEGSAVNHTVLSFSASFFCSDADLPLTLSRLASLGSLSFVVCSALFVCWLADCLTSHASVSQGRVCTDNFTRCRNETEKEEESHSKALFEIFWQSPLCVANCLQHVRSRGPGAIVCKSRATHRALITCNMSRCVPRGTKGQLRLLSLTEFNEGTAQLFSLTEFKQHLFQLYLIG